MKRHLPYLALSSTILVLTAGAASAGVVYEIETTDHSSSEREVTSTEMAAEGRNIKMTISSRESEDGDMIYRGDRREMVAIDHRDQSYVVIDEEAIQQLAGQLAAATAQFDQMMKSVPEGQRAQVEEMMRKRMPGGVERSPSELRKTAERGNKNGYPCVKYEVVRDGRVERELWVTDWSNIEGGSEISGAMGDMADFFSEMMDSFSSGAGGTFGGFMDDTAPFEHLTELGGFPVVIRGFEDDGTLEDESELRSATRRELDPADFEPPTGYRLRQVAPAG